MLPPPRRRCCPRCCLHCPAAAGGRGGEETRGTSGAPAASPRAFTVGSYSTCGIYNKAPPSLYVLPCSHPFSNPTPHTLHKTSPRAHKTLTLEEERSDCIGWSVSLHPTQPRHTGTPPHSRSHPLHRTICISLQRCSAGRCMARSYVCHNHSYIATA